MTELNKFHLLHETTPSKLGEVHVLSNAWKPTQRVKGNEETKEYIPTKRTK